MLHTYSVSYVQMFCLLWCKVRVFQPLFVENAMTPVAVLPVPTHAHNEARLFDGAPPAELELPFSPSNSEAGAQVRASVGVYDREGRPTGAVLAYGSTQPRYLLTEDGQYLQVLLHWPQVQCWGQGQCEYLKQRARMRCLEQYVQRACELAARWAVPHMATVVEFDGEWDIQSEPLRKRLVDRFVTRSYGRLLN